MNRITKDFHSQSTIKKDARQPNVSTAVQNLKCHDNLNKPVIWLRRFIKAHNVNHVKDSYLEGIQFTQDEATDVSLKQRLLFFKLKGVTQPQIQQSLALHSIILKEISPNFERNMIPQSAYEAPITTPFWLCTSNSASISLAIQSF